MPHSTIFDTPRRDGHSVRPWTSYDDRLLIQLRELEHKTYPDISIKLDRTIRACQQHYARLVQEREARYFDWTDEIDHDIIEGRRQGLTVKAIATQIATTMNGKPISHHAIEYRWLELKRENKVPADVLAIWTRKADLVWSMEEDDCIVALWTKGFTDEQIARAGQFKGKGMDDVVKRRRELITGEDPRYAKALGQKGGRNALEHALGVKKKYGWMK
ncbi:hypothetical protein BKA63DRAFT_548763 [Paraphoma chrysanthemicola]|nr:hypothetical protein BKA63DRAFT_548763 [Paraphoma chrysanthemicola]